MSNAKLNTAVLRSLLLTNPKLTRGICDQIFDELVEGNYTLVFEDMLHLSMPVIIEIAFAATVARLEEFSRVLNRMANSSDGDMQMPGKKIHFALLIGAIKGVTFWNAKKQLSRKQEEDFAKYIPIALNSGGLESPACLETELSDAMSEFFSGPNQSTGCEKRQAGLIATAILGAHWSTDAQEGTFLNKFVEELTHKYWANLSHFSRLQQIKEKYGPKPTEASSE